MRVQGFQDVLHHVLGQIGRQVGDLIGIEVLGSGEDLFRIHVREQRFAHGIGDFQQNISVPVRLHQIPDQTPFSLGQRLENVGNIRWVQRFELALQLGQILLVHQRLDELVARHLLLLYEVFDQTMLAQQRLHFLQMLLDRFLPLEFFYFSHGRRWR